MHCIEMPKAWLVQKSLGVCMDAADTILDLPQEEYVDLNTLEARLQDVARRYVKQTQVTTAQPNHSSGQQQGATSNPSAGPSSMGFASNVPPSNSAPGGMDTQQQQGGGDTLVIKDEFFASSPGSPTGLGQSNPVSQMVPSSAMGGSMGASHVTGSTMMHNGAPVMIKRDLNVSGLFLRFNSSDLRLKSSILTALASSPQDGVAGMGGEFVLP